MATVERGTPLRALLMESLEAHLLGQQAPTPEDLPGESERFAGSTGVTGAGLVQTGVKGRLLRSVSWSRSRPWPAMTWWTCLVRPSQGVAVGCGVRTETWMRVT